MDLTRRTLLAATSAGLLARPALIRAQTISAPIRIGEINSYATQQAVNGPYRQGWELALSQLNDRGGLDDRKVEILSRDDGGTPEGAVRSAAELVNEDKVDLLAGGFTSEIGLAISAYALRTKKLYIATEPLSDDLVWSKGNRYTYHIRPTTFMLAAMLVQTALTLPAKTYVTIAPNDDYGRSAVKWFRQLLSARRPDVRFVGEQWPGTGQVDAGAVGRPPSDAIFCALVGSDLLSFIRQGNTGGLFDKRLVVSMLTGEPETLLELANDTPVGWLVTGYPWSLSDEPDNKQFALDYTLKYNQPPGMGSVIGVAMVNAITSGVLKSGGTDTEKMADGFADATFTSPFGICRLRAIDHQSTLGAYVGRTAKQNGHGGMIDWGYVDGAAVMPPDDVVRTLRTG